MDLVTRVRRAIADRPVHPTTFEECACALLMERFPWLSAIEGGTDLGRDGDIYFPRGRDDTTGIGRILVTTGDPVANLRTGLKRMHDESLRADSIVVACLRPVNGKTRAKLDKLCAGYGLAPPEVYAESFFVARLVKEPAWRERLLGIKGGLSALLEQPLADLEHDIVVPELVGREDELARLAEVVADRGDGILTGLAGVGKTRLTTAVAGRVVFLERASLGDLVDELLEAEPAAVVVDDAHGREDDVRALRHVRRREGLSYSIIATTWPDRLDDVRTYLPRADVLHVDRLELAQMNQLITSLGVTGFHARQVVLEQADGRPGWALVLCELFRSGDGFDVASGGAHLRNVESFLRRVTDSDTASDTVACMAALGHMSTTDLHQLAPLIVVSPAELTGLVERIASSGLIDGNAEGWSLQPALRAPLVARWFFGERARRPWLTLMAAFPDRALALARAAIAAAGTGSIGARQEADRWAESLPDPSTWDVATIQIVSEYASLGEEAGRFAVTQASAMLAGPRQITEIHSIRFDVAADAATGLIKSVARQWVLPEAVTALLDLAVDEQRSRRQTMADPLSVLKDLARYIDPDYGTVIEIRERLLDYVLEWLDANAEPERWFVGTQLLAAVFSVEASGNWMDRGAPGTVTISHGVEGSANLERLMTLWPRVASAIEADRSSDDSTCPPRALRLLVDLADQWLQLGAGFSISPNELTEEQRQAGLAGGQQILESLRPSLQAVPGLALSAQRVLENVAERGRTPGTLIEEFTLDRDLEDLAGRRDPFVSEDFQTELLRRNAAHAGLARRLAELGPTQGTARFMELGEQARLADQHLDGGPVAWALKDAMADPLAWYRAAVNAGEPLLLDAALRRCFEDPSVSLPDETVDAALSNPKLRQSLITAVTARSEVDELVRRVADDLRANDASALGRLYRQEAPNDVIRLLLAHPVPAIAATTALGFAVGDQNGMTLPESWQADWNAAILSAQATELVHHDRWRLQETLKRLVDVDPDLVEKWFAQRIGESGYVSLPQPRGCEKHLWQLPRPHRERLSRLWAGRPWIGQSLLTYLVGRDQELAAQLLGDSTFSPKDLLVAVLDQRNEVLETLGPLLLDHGVAPDDIAGAASTSMSWSGSESAMHDARYEYFSQLAGRIPALAPVAEAGRRQESARRDEARATERHDRTFGR